MCQPAAGQSFQREPSTLNCHVEANPLYLTPNEIYCGDARELLKQVQPESVALSFWSPPYHVGKSYEADLSYEDWYDLLDQTVQLHVPILKPGGFLVINIADILCFADPRMPRIQADIIRQKRVSITREEILAAKQEHPEYNRHQLAALFGVSEQTIQRRLEHNNVRGGKYATQTRVKLVSGLVEEWGEHAQLFLYDRRVWIKDATWENSRWHSSSYRSVDEFEYLFFLWKPGITKVDRKRLSSEEWIDWGSRGVWKIRSVRANNDHPAKFPLELARRVAKMMAGEDDLVLDCFVGSGTTAAAAILEDRQFLGFDQEPEYVRVARARCRHAKQLRCSPESRQLVLGLTD